MDLEKINDEPSTSNNDPHIDNLVNDTNIIEKLDITTKDQCQTENAVDTATTTTTTPDIPNSRMNRKRRRVSEENIETDKVFLQDVDTYFGYSPLLNLSDEVLLQILKYCNSTDLDSLSQTCKRLDFLIYDRKLWKTFDFLDVPLSIANILKKIKHLNELTTEIKLRGLVSKYPLSFWSNNTLTVNLLNKIQLTCPNLEVLEILQGYLDFDKIKITDFPATLKKLTLRKCEILYPSDRKLFFYNIESHLVNLEEIAIEDARWFETVDLLKFSKLPKLKKLNLCGCTTFSDFVPYGSISTRFGFKTLEVLDIRNTPINDSDLNCFNIVSTLREILLECPEHLRATSKQNNKTVDTDAPTTSRGSLLRPPSTLLPPYEPRHPNTAPSIINIFVGPRRNETDDELENIYRQRVIAQRACVAPINQQYFIVRGYSDPAQNVVPPTCNRVHPISDRAICSFGIAPNNVQQGVVWIRTERRSKTTTLERLTVRHYEMITDTTLRHLFHCAPQLVYLDVTGTSVTAEGLHQFKIDKPNCVIVSDFSS